MFDIKKRNFNLYQQLIDNKDFINIVSPPNYGKSNYWFYPVKINNQYPKDVPEIINYLNENGVQSRPIWTLNHRQKPYRNCFHVDLSNALNLYNKIFNVPCSTNLKEKDINKVCDLL